MPFFIGTLATIFYVPYLLYRNVNSDLVLLQDEIKRKDPAVDKIAKHFFKKGMSCCDSLLPILFNFVIKILYVASNVVSFISCDYVLNGGFSMYGKKWIQWTQLNNTMAYDYMGMRDFPKPGI